MQKQRFKLALLIAVILMPFTVLQAQRTVKGNKNVTTAEHHVDLFSSIDVGSAFNVKLEKADKPKVVIETDENLHDQISVRVKNNNLSIGSKGISNATKLDVYIYYTELSDITLSGAATLKVSSPIESQEFTLKVSGAANATLTFEVEELSTQASGATKVKLDGRATKHMLEVSGAANLNAANLLTEFTSARVSGAGNARVTASEKIDADVSGAGKLQYYDGKSMVSVGKSGQFSIIMDEDVVIESSDYIDVRTSNNSDSVRIKIGNVEIEVFDGDQTRVRVGSGQLEVDESGRVQFKKIKRQERFNGHWSGIYLGVNGYFTDEGSLTMPEGYEFLDLRYGKSINFQLNLFEQNYNLVNNKFGMYTGLGFEWNNYRFEDHVRLDPNASVISLLPEESPPNYTKSKLLLVYLNVPIIFEFQTNPRSNVNSFHFGAGVVGGWRIGTHAKNVYKENGRQRIKTRNDFNVNPLKADLTVRLGWGKLNFYGNYSLTSLFREGQGPELHAFSAGLILLPFY